MTAWFPKDEVDDGHAVHECDISSDITLIAKRLFYIKYGIIVVRPDLLLRKVIKNALEEMVTKEQQQLTDAGSELVDQSPRSTSEEAHLNNEQSRRGFAHTHGFTDTHNLTVSYPQEFAQNLWNELQDTEIVSLFYRQTATDAERSDPDFFWTDKSWVGNRAEGGWDAGPSDLEWNECKEISNEANPGLLRHFTRRFKQWLARHLAP
ncbi:uncharacterized protein PG986_005148 [Apiospora aurea]|uniref:Uncharacterized protein n=1 Tax=Apiospora aurea TaxID=335848 RepID=A0ABR1QGQ6_9PEZI